MSKIKLDNVKVNNIGFGNDLSDDEVKEAITIKFVNFTDDEDDPGYDIEVYINKKFQESYSETFSVDNDSATEKLRIICYSKQYLESKLGEIFMKYMEQFIKGN